MKIRFWGILLFFVMVSVSMLSVTKVQAKEAEKNVEQVNVNIPVKIKITGEPKQKETFVFLLQQKNKDTPMPENVEVNLTETLEQAFQICYTRPGVYKYSLKQIAGNQKNWTYDQSEYTLEVYIVRNEKTDQLQSVLVAYDANGNKVDPVFENGYKAPEVKPKSMTVKTGDNADAGVMALLLVVSGSILTGIYSYKKKMTGK